jgi:hypothetical protein
VGVYIDSLFYEVDLEAVHDGAHGDERRNSYRDPYRGN